MSAQTTTYEAVEDDELDAIVRVLAMAVAGHHDADSGAPISEHGIGHNCGIRFENDTFALRDYCWCDGAYHRERTDVQEDDDAWEQAMARSGGEGSACPPNIELKAAAVGDAEPITGTWYKTIGRGQNYSRQSATGEALAILRRCLASLQS